MSTILQSLNKQQEEAVFHPGGPLLVLAGAGSGKTRVITCRIAHLIKEQGIRPHQILAVTFTNKAAREMKERIEAQLGNMTLPWMGTFHATAAKILRFELPKVGRSGGFTIIDTNDQLSIIKDAIRELKYDEKKINPHRALSVMSVAKNHLQSPDDFPVKSFGLYGDRYAEVYRVYQKTLSENNCMDFDDLISQTVLLLQNNKEIRERYQSQYKHLLIDEYQDVNYSQYLLAKTLCGEHRNIFVVGDDDQSIYGFRGADVSIILRFEQDFPGAKIIKLEENYRSTGIILDAAHAVVKQNKGRKEKKLWTSKGGGEKISTHACMDGREEARHLVDEINKWMQKGMKFKDFAVLYRTNSQSRSVEEVLKQEGLDYEIIGGLRFYERAEIKDAVSYLKFIVNPKDYLSFKRIINVPSRGIGNVTQDKIIQESILQSRDLLDIMTSATDLPRVGKKIQQTLNEFSTTILKLRKKKEKMMVSDFINEVLNEVGYFEMLKEDPDPRSFERIDNLEELINDAKEFEMAAEDRSMEAFLEKIALFTDIDARKDPQEIEEGKVTLMTVHSAKGLEFPIVFIVGLEEGLFPHFRSIEEGKESAIEEERRLFYVALTRAMKKVYLSYARERTLQGRSHNQSPSRFLREIPQDLIDKYLPELSQRTFTRKIPGMLEKPKKEEVRTDKYMPGNQVYHKIFGVGLVKKSEKGYVTADFHGVGSKVLSQEYLNPYGGDTALQNGDKVLVDGGLQGIIEKLDGGFAYVILSGGNVEKFEQSKLTVQKG